MIKPDAVKYDENHLFRLITYCIKMIVKAQAGNLATNIFNHQVKRSIEMLNTL